MSRDSLPLPPAPREPLGREDVTVLVPGSAGAFPAKAVLTEATRGRLEMHLLTAESSCWLEWNTARGALSQAQPAHTRLVLGVWRAPSPAHSPVLRPGSHPTILPKGRGHPVAQGLRVVAGISSGRGRLTLEDFAKLLTSLVAQRVKC